MLAVGISNSCHLLISYSIHHLNSNGFSPWIKDHIILITHNNMNIGVVILITQNK